MINSFGTGKPTEADGSGRGTGKRTEAAEAVRAVRLFGLFGCSAVRAVRLFGLFGLFGRRGLSSPAWPAASVAKPPPKQEPAELNFKVLSIVNNKFVN